MPGAKLQPWQACRAHGNRERARGTGCLQGRRCHCSYQCCLLSPMDRSCIGHRELALEERTLGTSRLEVSALGLRCVGMSNHCSTTMQRDVAIALARKAVDLGVTFFDKAQVYGRLTNEQLVGDALTPVRGLAGVRLGSARDNLTSSPARLNPLDIWIQSKLV